MGEVEKQWILHHFAPTHPLSIKGKNPLDKDGNLTQCLNCESVNHWAPNCSDKNAQGTYIAHKIVLHQNNSLNPEQMKVLVDESLGALD